MRKPNILIIIADDCTYHDLPFSGGINVETPHLSQLASEGILFDNAYLCMAMCTPCRTELYTGLYPVRNGCCWNHAPARPQTRSIAHHLTDLGYRVGLAGKKHVFPESCFPFENVPGVTGNCVAEVTEFDPAGILDFMNRNPREPFCLVMGLVEPHVPWTMGDFRHFDPQALELPPYFADTPATRRDYAKYLAEIEVLDDRVGQTLGALERAGRADDTLVIFTSEQGAQFPGAKWTNWNTGVHTAFLVRWPGRVEPGRRTDAMVQYVDVAPTLLEVAGADPSCYDLDGASFLPLLLGERDHHRTHAWFMHNNIPDGPPYPIRAVTDGVYHYIRNLTPEAIYIEKHLMGEQRWHEYWPSWLFDATFNEHTRALVHRYLRRPPEQLYRVDKDPFELTNLADDASHAAAKTRLAAALDDWMQSQGDPGADLDSPDQWQAAKEGRRGEMKRE